MAITACLATAPAYSADTGARTHAKGTYDSVTLTYVVADGDDLFAISERFEVPVETLKSLNGLTADGVKSGQTLKVAASAHTSTHASPSHHAAAKKPLATMTCEEFVGLEESYQPKAVYWAVAYGKHGEPEAEAVDIEGVETLVPFVVEECRKTPKETFWQKVKAEWKTVEAKL
jgi:LysM repeat protein